MIDMEGRRYDVSLHRIPSGDCGPDRIAYDLVVESDCWEEVFRVYASAEEERITELDIVVFLSMLVQDSVWGKMEFLEFCAEVDMDCTVEKTLFSHDECKRTRVKIERLFGNDDLDDVMRGLSRLIKNLKKGNNIHVGECGISTT